MEKIKSIGQYFSSRGTEENFYTTGRAVVWFARKILNHGIIYTKKAASKK
jgi:hypothetical protein